MADIKEAIKALVDKTGKLQHIDRAGAESAAKTAQAAKDAAKIPAGSTVKPAPKW